MVMINWSHDFVSCNSVFFIKLMTKQLHSCPILLITHMISDTIGLHSVLLPLLCAVEKRMDAKIEPHRERSVTYAI